jgi:hypothetical protein
LGDLAHNGVALAGGRLDLIQIGRSDGIHGCCRQPSKLFASGVPEKIPDLAGMFP